MYNMKLKWNFVLKMSKVLKNDRLIKIKTELHAMQI